MRTEVFDYIETFYNRQRRHRSLGMLSPAQFETISLERALAHPPPVQREERATGVSCSRACRT